MKPEKITQMQQAGEVWWYSHHQMEVLQKRIADMENRIDRLENALDKISDWAKAYPASVFPPLSSKEWAHAAVVLSDAGLSLDRISAANMLHVITQVEKIAQHGTKDQT